LGISVIFFTSGAFIGIIVNQLMVPNIVAIISCDTLGYILTQCV